MDKISITVPTFITFSTCLVAAAYFFGRFWLYRRLVSLSLVFMCLGWGVAGAVMNGTVAREHYDPLRWFSAAVSILLLGSIISVEIREGTKRRR